MTVRKETVLIEQIDKLIKAFGQLDSLEKPKPSKETWQKAEQLAKKEYEEKQRKNALAMGLSSTPSTPKSPLQTKVPDKLIERKCLEIDEKYRAALSQSGEQTKETAKQIDRTLYPIQGRLLEFHRAKRTLLKENWGQLRQNFGLEKVLEFQRQGWFVQAIDALEAIKGKIEWQQKIEPAKKPAETERNEHGEKVKRIRQTVASLVNEQNRKTVKKVLADELLQIARQLDSGPVDNHTVIIEHQDSDTPEAFAKSLSSFLEDFPALMCEKMVYVDEILKRADVGCNRQLYAILSPIQRAFAKLRGHAKFLAHEQYKGFAIQKAENLFNELCKTCECYSNRYSHKLEELAGEIQGLENKTTDESTETEWKIKPVKEPPKEAAQAYKLYYGTGKSQTEVAEIMMKELRKPVNQGQVSRWVKEYKIWARANNIPISEKSVIINMDSDKLIMGKRTNGRGTGDPRHKAKVDPDGDAYE